MRPGGRLHVDERVRSVFLGTSGLAIVLAVAVGLALARPAGSGDPDARRRARFAAWLAIGIQGAHFVEELLSGFRIWFPEQLGLAPWSAAFFVGFNVSWLAIWILAVLAAGRMRLAVDAALLFLAMASMVNGIAHPLLALREGAYVPGLVTAPFAGAAGWLLWRARWALRKPSVPVPGVR